MLGPMLTLCLLQAPATRAPAEVAAGEAAYEQLMPAHKQFLEQKLEGKTPQQIDRKVMQLSGQLASMHASWKVLVRPSYGRWQVAALVRQAEETAHFADLLESIQLPEAKERQARLAASQRTNARAFFDGAVEKAKDLGIISPELEAVRWQFEKR